MKHVQTNTNPRCVWNILNPLVVFDAWDMKRNIKLPKFSFHDARFGTRIPLYPIYGKQVWVNKNLCKGFENANKMPKFLFAFSKLFNIAPFWRIKYKIGNIQRILFLWKFWKILWQCMYIPKEIREENLIF